MSKKLDWKFISDATGFKWNALLDGILVGKSSESFKTSSSAKYNAGLLGYNGTYSKNAVWDFIRVGAGWMWKAIASNKEEIAKSHTIFSTQDEAKANASLFGFDWSDAAEWFARTSGTASSAVNFTTTPTRQSYSSSTTSTTDYVSTVGDNDDVGVGWLKWLLPGLLLLGLLGWGAASNWWGLTNKSASSSSVSVSSLSLSTSSSSVVSVSSSLNSSVVSSATSSSVATYTPKIGGLIATLASKPEFSTFVSAINTAGLTETLDGTGPFTVFAPNNEAFDKLAAGTLTNLLKPENKAQLTALLKNHIVSGTYGDANFVQGTNVNVTSLQGTALALSAMDGYGSVQGPKNTISAPVASFTASNATVHPVTGVLIN